MELYILLKNKKKRFARRWRTDKGGHSEKRIVKGDFVSRLMSRLSLDCRALNLN